MKNNPGRKARRNLFFEAKRRQGDLNRRSTHTMRTNMGMHVVTKVEVKDKAGNVLSQDIGRNAITDKGFNATAWFGSYPWWQRILAWIKSKIRRLNG